MDKQQSKSGLALAGVIIGAIAVGLSAIPIINNFAFLLAVLALVFGIVGLIQTRGGRKGGRGRAVTSVILAVVAVVVILVSQSIYSAALNEASKGLKEASSEASDSVDKSTGKKTDELLKNDVTVELGAFSASQDQYGLSTTALPIKVTNKNAEKKSYSIQVEAVDASGSRIVDDTVYANDLGSGQSQGLNAFQYVAPDKVDAMKAAAFKIVSVSQS